MAQGLQHLEEASGGGAEEERLAQKIEKIGKGLLELQGDLCHPPAATTVLPTLY